MYFHCIAFSFKYFAPTAYSLQLCSSVPAVDTSDSSATPIARRLSVYRRAGSPYLPDEPHGQQKQAEHEPVVLEVDVVHHEQTRVQQDEQADVGGARCA